MRALLGVLVVLLLCAGVGAAAANETYKNVTVWGGEKAALGPLWHPGAMGVAPDGSVYLACDVRDPDDGTHASTIKKFTPSGAYASTLANMGWDDGEVERITGLAVDTAGNIYVTDYWTTTETTPRVQKFSPGGSFIRKWGSNGTGDGQFYGYQIGSIAVDAAGYVYVIDAGNRRIQKFDQDGVFVTKWAIAGNTAQERRTPRDIATSPDGTVHVLVSAFDESNQIRYVVQTYTASGLFLREWGTKGTADGQFFDPSCLAVDPAGNIYVADYTNYESLVNRFQKFSPTGQFIGAWRSDPPPDGKADEYWNSRLGITDLSVDGDYTVYAAEFEGARILLYQVVRPDFTATPSSGFAPLGVQFTDTSVGNPSSCSWNFGDGGHSTDWNPLHTYESPGTYTVSHNLYSPVWGISQVVKTDVITVHAPLKAGFTATPRAGYETLRVQFTDTSTGSPTSWAWNFGDGATSTAQHPSHVFAAPGSYTVVLSVTNPVAGTKTATKTGYITVLSLTGGMVKVQAEDYDEGGEGTAYHDTTAGNSGGTYRSEDVDIVAITGMRQAYAVTNTAEGEWTRYTVLSPGTAPADYPLTLRVASWAALQSIGISVNGTAGETIFLPNTNLATSYTNVNATVRLGAGLNTVRLYYHGSAMNVDSFTIDPAGARPAVLAVPPGTALPTDTDGDGVFEDVNGNARADFADVVLYFNQMTWIAANEPVSAFDYNKNGRIDFADVVWLFNHL